MITNGRRSRDAVLMDCAFAFSARSTCTRSKVGAIIGLEGRVLQSGYNGTPAGMPHCDHTCICHNPQRPSHRKDCPAGSPCREAVHAEANAIVWAARNGIKIEGATVYTTMSPCYACSQLIITSGLVRVVYATAYRDGSGLRLLESGGVEVVSVDDE